MLVSDKNGLRFNDPRWLICGKYWWFFLRLSQYELKWPPPDMATHQQLTLSTFQTKAFFEY